MKFFFFVFCVPYFCLQCIYWLCLLFVGMVHGWVLTCLNGLWWCKYLCPYIIVVFYCRYENWNGHAFICSSFTLIGLPQISSIHDCFLQILCVYSLLHNLIYFRISTMAEILSDVLPFSVYKIICILVCIYIVVEPTGKKSIIMQLM